MTRRERPAPGLAPADRHAAAVARRMAERIAESRRLEAEYEAGLDPDPMQPLREGV